MYTYYTSVSLSSLKYSDDTCFSILWNKLSRFINDLFISLLLIFVIASSTLSIYSILNISNDLLISIKYKYCIILIINKI